MTKPDTMRKAIAYGVQKNYVTNDPWQVQLAVWYFAEGNTKVNEKYGALVTCHPTWTNTHRLVVWANRSIPSNDHPVENS